MSSSESEGDDHEVLEFEPDPANVHVHWEKTAKSTILLTHQMNYKWYRQDTSKDGSIIR